MLISGSNNIEMAVDTVNDVVYMVYGNSILRQTYTGAWVPMFSNPFGGSQFNRMHIALDNTQKLYMGIDNFWTWNQTTNNSYPLGTAPPPSTIFTYTLGASGTAPPWSNIVSAPIQKLSFDENNNHLYICANTNNKAYTNFINGTAYSSIARYDGSTFSNIADIDGIYSFTALNDKQMAFMSTKRSSANTINDINSCFYNNGGIIDTNASLTITAPINYYNGSTGSSYTLTYKGKSVDMKWSSQTNSWWV
jgi:hypothetical protein